MTHSDTPSCCIKGERPLGAEYECRGFLSPAAGAMGKGHGYHGDPKGITLPELTPALHLHLKGHLLQPPSLIIIMTIASCLHGVTSNSFSGDVSTDQLQFPDDPSPYSP